MHPYRIDMLAKKLDGVDPTIMKYAHDAATDPDVKAVYNEAIKRASVGSVAKTVGGVLLSQKSFEAMNMGATAKKRLNEGITVPSPSEKTASSSKTVVLDFDGTLSTYKSGWQGIDTIQDGPVDGWKSELKKLVDAGYELVVVSSRCVDKKGISAIKGWLRLHGLDTLISNVQATKPPHKVVIDDRAISFNGNPSGIADRVMSFKSWTEGK